MSLNFFELLWYWTPKEKLKKRKYIVYLNFLKLLLQSKLKRINFNFEVALKTLSIFARIVLERNPRQDYKKRGSRITTREAQW